jgi:hypothetical protein
MGSAVRTLFLDIDGVLNRAGFQPQTELGLRAWIEPELAGRLSTVVRRTGAQLVLSSDWRVDRELGYLRDELRAAGVDGELVGATPVLVEHARWREIHAWMTEHHVETDEAVIVDDARGMGPLRKRFVRTRSDLGLDATAAEAIVRLFG